MLIVAVILAIANLIYWGRQGARSFFLALFSLIVGFLLFK